MLPDGKDTTHGSNASSDHNRPLPRSRRGGQGCDEGTTGTTATTVAAGSLRATYDFENGSDGWARQVSDFTAETRPHDVISETGVAPPGFEASDGFFHPGATNRSASLFLYMMRRIGSELDLAPDTAYRVEFTVSAASAAPSDCAGVGGSPGESVWMKLGASQEKPAPVADQGETELTIDKGTPSRGGEHATAAGTIANGTPCDEALAADTPYAMVTWSGSAPTPVTTDDQGRMWLFVGTESGFEGRTDLYYDEVSVMLEPVG